MSAELAITSEQTEFTQQQVAALTQLGVDNASPADLAIFFNQAQRTGLDPFSRQIYMIGRRSQGQVKQTIQVGIDGLRLIAHRTAKANGETLGMEDTLWADSNGRWHDLWLGNTPPSAAKVTVLRNGQRFSAVAVFSEYAASFNGKLSSMWASKPALMIAKCAEALALRKAFPADMSGLYTAEEMSQADVQESMPVQASQPQQSAPSKPRLAAKRLQVEISTIFKECGVDSKELAGAALSLLANRTVATTAELTADEAKTILADKNTRQRVTELVEATKAQAEATTEQSMGQHDIIDAEIVED